MVSVFNSIRYNTWESKSFKYKSIFGNFCILTILCYGEVVVYPWDQNPKNKSKVWSKKQTGKLLPKKPQN